LAGHNVSRRRPGASGAEDAGGHIRRRLRLGVRAGLPDPLVAGHARHRVRADVVHVRAPAAAVERDRPLAADRLGAGAPRDVVEGPRASAGGGLGGRVAHPHPPPPHQPRRQRGPRRARGVPARDRYAPVDAVRDGRLSLWRRRRTRSRCRAERWIRRRRGAGQQLARTRAAAMAAGRDLQRRSDVALQAQAQPHHPARARLEVLAQRDLAMTVALIYHDVVAAARQDECGFPGPVAARYKLEPDRFEAHLDAIAATGVTVGGLGDGSGVALTFDDGGASALDAAELLERREWRGHFFITTGRIGTPGFLTAAGVSELAERGHTVGSH